MAGQTSLVIPLPRDTSSYGLRAAGEEGFTQGQVQGGLLGCPCVPQHSLCTPSIPGMACDAQLVWKNKFKVCSWTDSGGSGESLGHRREQDRSAPGCVTSGQPSQLCTGEQDH